VPWKVTNGKEDYVLSELLCNLQPLSQFVLALSSSEARDQILPVDKTITG
jgi:hypothetical protein